MGQKRALRKKVAEKKALHLHQRIQQHHQNGAGMPMVRWPGDRCSCFALGCTYLAWRAWQAECAKDLLRAERFTMTPAQHPHSQETIIRKETLFFQFQSTAAAAAQNAIFPIMGWGRMLQLGSLLLKHRGYCDDRIFLETSILRSVYFEFKIKTHH